MSTLLGSYSLRGMPTFRDTEDALRRAKKLVTVAVGDVDKEAVAAHFDALFAIVRNVAPKSPFAPGEWGVRPPESFRDNEIRRTPRGKLICPLCGLKMWGEDALRGHLSHPHGTCPQEGCGQVVTAAGLGAHLASRHDL